MDMMLVLIIFVTLGIGADDVFVFVDAFKQSEAVAQACGSLLSRLDYTMNRSCKVNPCMCTHQKHAHAHVPTLPLPFWASLWVM